MMLMKDGQSVHSCFTMGKLIHYVGSDIRDRQLELGCVDRLNTEGGRGSVSWPICVRTRKDYA